MTSYYDEIRSNNLIRLLRGLLKSGGVSLRGSDGKFIANLTPLWETPWVHTKSSYRISCYLWKEITFHEIVEKNLPRQAWFAPAGCHDCFKVVVRPKTLAQLFALERLQIRMSLPSKCGIHVTPSVFGNYGGYFYNRGLPEGLECYEKVRAEIDADPELGKDITVHLKRACTDMENSLGSSDKWELTQEQLVLEMKISQRFVNDIPVLVQSDEAKDYVKQRWIERAFSVGDETVSQFTGGVPLHPEYITYEHLLEKYNEEKQNA